VTLQFDHITEANRKSPNVIFVIHESLSGEIMMAKESSVKVTPFLQQMFRSKDEYFVFENARSVSGDTVDAMSGIHSGCIPLDHKEGRTIALNNTIGAEFKRKGYNTVSFSSRETDLEGTKWWMMSNILGGVNFDQVHDPRTTKDPLVNGPARDDVAMGKHFQKWLGEKKKREGDVRQPFYAQFYYYNGHYPFFNNQNVSKTTDTVDGLLSTVDRSIENIVRLLKEAGELDNTIIIGTGDHGENLPRRGFCKRLAEWDEEILHPMMYMYVPREISKKSPGIYENLRYNTRQLVSILDIFPTILHFLDGIPKENYPVTNEHCVRGFDLLKNKIPSNRVAWSFPGVSRDISKTTRGSMALHSGTSSSLMNRFGWNRRNFLSIVEYATIIHPTRNNESKVYLRDFNDWNSIIENMAGTSDEEVLNNSSHCITSFLNNLARLSA